MMPGRMAQAAITAACALALGGAAATAPARAEDAARARVLAAAREIMQKARYCALVTIGSDGHPQARIVDPLAPEPDFTVWIGTHQATRKVAEIRADPRVTLFYFDAASRAYVTVVASAEVVNDPAEKARRFKSEWTPFYEDAHRSADFVLIRARAKRLEVVSEGQGITSDPATWRPTTVELP